MPVEFEVIFFADERGRAPIVQLLEDLRVSQPVLHRLLTAGLSRLQTRLHHGPPLTRLVDQEHDIFELRVGRDDIARIFFFFQSGQRIIVTNGYVKKQQRLDRRELERARRCQMEWMERNG